MKNKQGIRVIISGGGTGGHIYPALSIAHALKELKPDIDILFVGASGRMEMEKVPAAGYPIIGLPITGLQRSLSLKNILFPFRLIISLLKAGNILRKFKPDVAVGVGGYASGALLYAASLKKIPCLIQEQNSYPGITNKLLKDKAARICTAYPGMERFFPAEKILLTGNPVRKDLNDVADKKAEAYTYFGIPEGKKVILIVGGSLGARTLNQAMLQNIESFRKDELFILWQCGKYYLANMTEAMKDKGMNHIKLMDFISRMDLAFAAADVIVSRAGAGTISELCLVGKPVILVPSPNVAEDHQTHNAQSLVKEHAAIMIRDAEAVEKLPAACFQLLSDSQQAAELGKNIRKLALPQAALDIAHEVFKLIN